MLVISREVILRCPIVVVHCVIIKLILPFTNMPTFLADIISLNVSMDSSESHQQ